MTSAPDRGLPEDLSRGGGYDVMVDWDRRLARELPFFERLFEHIGVRTVVDVGCGTGRHAIALAQRGFDVTGVDPSEEMLETAKATAAAMDVKVRFLDGGFGGLAELGVGRSDALICTGNALPHVEGVEGLRAALADFAAVLRPGGALVLHLLNHERLLAQRPRSLPVNVRHVPGGTAVFLRLLEYDPPEAPERIWIEFMTAAKDEVLAEAGDPDLGWSATAHRSAHTALPLAMLERALDVAGFHDTAALGDHSGKAFEPLADESVIITARRR